MNAPAKNVLGRPTITAWAGVAGAVLSCVGVLFAMASARLKREFRTCC